MKNNDENLQWAVINKVWVVIYLSPFCSDSNPCIGCITELFGNLYADRILQKQVICLDFCCQDWLSSDLIKVNPEVYL